MSTKNPTPLVFSESDATLLGQTADALTAYTGKPVLAQIILIDDEGNEGVLFAIPLDKSDSDEPTTPVQLGGKNARFLGNTGGLKLDPNTPYSCRFLWAIQRVQIEHIRFVKIDEHGDEVGWSDTLETLLPFNVNEPPAPDDDSTPPNDDSTSSNEATTFSSHTSRSIH